MKIILLENVRKVGSIGDIIDVRRGFARNFLISKKKQTITFDNLPSRPIPSIFRDFSAPITLVQPMPEDDLYILAE